MVKSQTSTQMLTNSFNRVRGENRKTKQIKTHKTVKRNHIGQNDDREIITVAFLLLLQEKQTTLGEN